MKCACLAACAVAIAAAMPIAAAAQGAGSVTQFLDLWGKAWDAHDVDAIMHLTADDCSMVSRFGILSNGKDEIRRSVTWLHNGPFHDAHFTVPKLLDQRKLGSGITVLHASWKNPSGRANPPEDDMVLTVVLRDLGSDGWMAEEIDMHTVEPLAPAVVPDAASSKP